VAAALEFLTTVPLEQLRSAAEVQLLVFEHLQVCQSSRVVYRSHLKCFLTWCEAQGWFTTLSDSAQSAATPIAIHQFKRPNGERHTVQSNVTGRRRKATYALGAVAGDYINPRLQQQLEMLEHFSRVKLHLRPHTLRISQPLLLELLGWLHRSEGIPLEALSLESLVTVVLLNLQLADFTTATGALAPLAYAAAKSMAVEDAMAAGRRTVQLVERYLKFVQGALGTQVAVLTIVTRVAKCLYDGETNVSLYDHYEDIPVIQQLRTLVVTLKRARQGEPAQVPFERKSVSWNQALDVLLALKRLADIEVRYAKDSSQRGYRVRSRHATGVGMSYQRFLSLAFFVLIPPDRARTVYELEVGRTLVWGYFQEGIFVATDNQEHPTAAWFIHLQPEDYKTGAAYGEYWGSIPNESFGDGTCFYDYIHRWLQELRPLFHPDHSLFFVQRNGQPLSSKALYARLRYFFQKFTSVPVTPKEFRRMYVTQLYAEGASEAEKEAAGCAMHQSRRMQATVYNQLDNQRLTAPIHAFNEKAFAAFLERET
jgi:hypothetical protein